MHFVELKRWQDIRNPGSVDADPLFPSNKLAPHDVGYPGGIFAPFVPGSLEELKVCVWWCSFWEGGGSEPKGRERGGGGGGRTPSTSPHQPNTHKTHTPQLNNRSRS